MRPSGQRGAGAGAGRGPWPRSCVERSAAQIQAAMTTRTAADADFDTRQSCRITRTPALFGAPVGLSIRRRRVRLTPMTRRSIVLIAVLLVPAAVPAQAPEPPLADTRLTVHTL